MLSGKNAVITGARTGIGQAAVDLFAKNGANIWACLRDADPDFHDYADFLASRYGVWIKTIYIDLGNEASIKTGIKEILTQKNSIDVCLLAFI